MTFSDERLQNKKISQREGERRKKKATYSIETRDQKLGLADNAAATAGVVFIIAFSALIITT